MRARVYTNVCTLPLLVARPTTRPPADVAYAHTVPSRYARTHAHHPHRTPGSTTVSRTRSRRMWRLRATRRAGAGRTTHDRVFIARGGVGPLVRLDDTYSVYAVRTPHRVAAAV